MSQPTFNERVDAIDWASLKRKGGKAETVPKQLRLLGGEPAQSGTAWESLHGWLVGEGKWFSAGAEAVPFLLELAIDEDVPTRAEVLILVVDILAADRLRVATQGIDLTDMATAELYAQAPAKDVLEGVRRRYEAIVGLLDASDATVRAAAALLLALLSEHADRTLKVVIDSLARELDDNARASKILCAGLLSRYVGTTSHDTILADFASDEDASALVRAAVAFARIYVHGDTAPTQVFEAAMAAVDVGALSGTFPWHHGKVDELAAALLTAHAPNGRMLAARAFSSAVARGGVGNQNAGPWARHATEHAFPRPGNTRPPAPFRLEDLDEDQRAVVADLSHFQLSTPWMGDHGLPHTLEDRRSLLGDAPARAVDAQIDVPRKNGPQVWPVWYAWRMLEREGAPWADVEALIVDQLSPPTVLAVVGEAFGRYFQMAKPPLETLQRAVDAAGAEAAATWAKAYLAEARNSKARGTRFHKVASHAVMAAIILHTRAEKALDADHDSLVRLQAMPREDARRVLQAMSPARREAPVLKLIRRMNRGSHAKVVHILERVLDLIATPEIESTLRAKLTRAELSYLPDGGANLVARVDAVLFATSE